MILKRAKKGHTKVHTMYITVTKKHQKKKRENKKTTLSFKPNPTNQWNQIKTLSFCLWQFHHTKIYNWGQDQWSLWISTVTSDKGSSASNVDSNIEGSDYFLSAVRSRWQHYLNMTNLLLFFLNLLLTSIFSSFFFS